MGVDLIVAGAGPGGLATAVTAAREGLDVMLVDPLERLGGNAAISTGYLAVVGSDEQRAEGIADDPELCVRDLLREVDQYRGVASPHFDEELANEFASHTADAYALLRELGFRFTGFVNRPAQYSVPRLLKLAEPAAFHFLFGRECARLDVRIELRTRLVGLDTEAGAVRGAVLRSSSGDELVTARHGVVVATGGYQADPELRRRAWPDMGADTPYLGVATTRGDGHRLLEEQGVHLLNMSFLPRIVMIGSALAEDVIAVDAAGRRFHDETGPSEERVRAVHAAGPSAHYLFDETARLRYPDLVGQLPGGVVTAPSLAELAGAIGCDQEALGSTVAAWNATVARGQRPDEFGRVILPPTSAGIVTAPFHASACRIGSAFTIGGAATDGAGRALGTPSTPAGLYAVGDSSGVVNAASGTGGVHITSALVFGRAAGLAAATS